jgi:hypothetical protein
MKRGGGAGGRKEEEGRRGEGGGDAKKLGWQTDNKTRHRGVHQPGAPSLVFWIAAAKFLTQHSAGSSQADVTKIVHR